MNKYNSYPNREMWQEEFWKERHSQILPLTKRIGVINLENFRIHGKPEGERRTEGMFDRKPNALTHPEVVEELKAKGLHYYCAAMGKIAWIILVPEEHMGKSGYDDDMDTVLVMTNAERADPNWCMYTLEKYKDYVDAAARGRFTLFFTSADELDRTNHYINITSEAMCLFHLNYNRFWLDVSPVLKTGGTLKDIDGFNYRDDNGRVVSDPDSLIKDICGIPVIDIATRWNSNSSLNVMLYHSPNYSTDKFNKDDYMASIAAREMADALVLEYKYDRGDDPELMERWAKMGLVCDFHSMHGEQWVTFVPKEAFDMPEKKLPCMCVFMDVDAYDPHQAVSAFSYFYHYMEIAAQGDCMLLFFAMDKHEDNEILHDMLEEAETLYPMLDRGRVYITGHSHNGHFSAEYARRYPMDITAVATLGNNPGFVPPELVSGFFRVSDEQLITQSKTDTPIIILSSCTESDEMFPLHSAPVHTGKGGWGSMTTFEQMATSWQRRLMACRCPEKSFEEIAATKDSEDIVERMLGIPADKTECLYLDGSDHYIADVKNVDGKYHLRVVGLGNAFHTVTPSMMDLSWSYVKRFARNRETGEIIELY